MARRTGIISQVNNLRAHSMKTQRPSPVDQLISGFDTALRTLTEGNTAPTRSSPGAHIPEQELTSSEKKHAAGLMRVNHSGEVCAQALYQGQALTAKLPDVREEMNKAAEEEVDHLAWCEDRLKELGSHRSLLNPAWYTMSFGIGALAGLIGDKVSLGFVAATEDQVCTHLRSHMESLPENDVKSRAIVSQMLEDEAKHAHAALDAGGIRFPSLIKSAMTQISNIMTKTSYRA